MPSFICFRIIRCPIANSSCSVTKQEIQAFLEFHEASVLAGTAIVPPYLLSFGGGTSRLEYPIYEPFEDTWGGGGYGNRMKFQDV